MNNWMRGRLEQTHLLRILGLVVFVLAAVLLIHSDMPVIRSASSELGDFAMYSLFVQDAKHFHLLHGNPSRIGFYHPGPALIYMLAFGEGVLHDWLHLVPSPIAGQLISVALYNSLWIALSYVLLVRLAHSKVASALALSVFLVVTALQAPEFFRSIWFPYLYFFPFAIFILATARLIEGEADSLFVQALALGVLINGHVCFIPVGGLILMFAVGANYLLVKPNPGRRLLSPEFIKAHWRAILAAGGVFFLFLLPLLIATAIHFPGPLPDYFHFGEHRKPNGLVASLGYMAIYFGGYAAMLLALLAGVGAWLLVGRSAAKGSSLRAVLVALIAATGAMAFYVRYGIDQLDQEYIGLFYYAVPGILSISLVLIIFRTTEFGLKTRGAWFLALILVGVVYHIQRHPLSEISEFEHPEVAELYRSLETVGGERLLVLDLSQGDDWVSVWTRIIGVELYAKRQNRRLFCIREGWNVIFGKDAQCSEYEIRNLDALFVRASSASTSVYMNRVLEGMGLAFYRFSTLTNKGYIPVTDKQDLLMHNILGKGWSGVENNFVWTDSDQALLYLPLDREFSGMVELDLAAYLPKPGMSQQIDIAVNGKIVADAKFDQANNRRRVIFHIKDPSQPVVKVEISVAHPYSPKAQGVSNDPRFLGVALHGMKIQADNIK